MQGYTLTPNIKLQIFKVHIYKSMVKDFTTEYQEKPPFPQAQAQAAQVHVKDNSSTKAWLLSIKLWLLSIDGYMSISKSCSINQLSVISIYIGTIKTMQLSLGKMFSFSDTWFFTLYFMTLNLTPPSSTQPLATWARPNRPHTLNDPVMYSRIPYPISNREDGDIYTWNRDEKRLVSSSTLDQKGSNENWNSKKDWKRINLWPRK